MHKKTSILIIILFLSIIKTSAQYTQEEIKNKPYFVGSSAFILANLSSDETPNFVQLNLGYRISTKNAISIELKTWRYFAPLGIPYGKAKTDPNNNFPGHVKEKGFAIAYQRFLWKGLYSSIHVMSAWQDFINENGQKIDNGFQIFNTYRLGYHIKLFKRKFFIEPSLAITHRPYHTEMPKVFKQLDDKSSKWFFREPGLHFGFNF